jgi:cytochrome b involved in lipid metabolism
MTKTFSLKDVAEHNTKESPWFIIRGKVYDVTQLLSKHPGGEKVLLEYAGKDATPGFEGRDHSDKAKNWMKDFAIGSLGDQPKPWYRCGLYQALIGAGVVIGVGVIIGVAVRKASKH